MDTVKGSQNVLQAGGSVKFFAVCDEGDIDVAKILFVRIEFAFLKYMCEQCLHDRRHRLRLLFERIVFHSPA